MRREASFYKGLQARRGYILSCLLLAICFPSVAHSGDIAGRIETGPRVLRPGEPGFGRPGGWHAALSDRAPIILIRSPEMITTRRGGPLTIERRIVAGQVEPPFEVLRLLDTVRVTNDDTVDRRLFVFSEQSTRILGPLAPGASLTFRLERFGPCALYTDAPGATRSLVIAAENPFLAEAGPDGRFLMDGVPPGTFDVLALGAGRRSAPSRAVVDFDGVVTVQLHFR